MGQETYEGPAWDNSDEYKSLEDPILVKDLKTVKSMMNELEDMSLKLKRFVPKAGRFTPPETNSIVPVMQEVFKLSSQAKVLLGNVSAYASCRVVVDGNDSAAKSMVNQCNELSSSIKQYISPLNLIIAKASNDTIHKYLDDPNIKHSQYLVEELRKQVDHKLSTAEEELIVALGIHGFDSWNDLYGNLSGSIKCVIEHRGETQVKGLASAANLLESSDPELREKAMKAINKGWEPHKESCAAALNALAGTRHELYKRRSQIKKMHYLDESLMQSRIERGTLDAIMSAVGKGKHLGQRALKAQAKALGKDTLGPWDRFVPAPSLGGDEGMLTFEGAIRLIKDAFATVNPEMADFVQMMQDRRWIEGRVGDAKRPGAFCTKFPKSRNPRVYMSYSGGMNNVLTLAHELGHAFHNWKLKDISREESKYPLTLAETASIFSETVVNDALEKATDNAKDLFRVRWNVAREAEGLLLNVSSRYTFEQEFYEKRLKGYVNADEITDMMQKHWKDWYGDALSEMDPLFWCSKLHFYISSVSFYNYPYIFGYLFSLGVYAQKDRQGKDFYQSYINLLMDTGRMSAEDVAKKHLGVDLTEESFWADGMGIVETKVKAFEDSVESLF